MKRNNQASRPKLQRNSKSQRRKGVNAEHPVFTYPLVADTSLVVNETADGASMSRQPFDLEERTARFGEAIVRFSKKIPRDPTNDRLIDQLVGCGTSVGGNYCEANEGVSKKDFRHMISRCVKESKETKFFLRMIALPNRTSPKKHATITAKPKSYISSSPAFFAKLKSQPSYEGRRSKTWKFEVRASLDVGNWRLVIKT
jgi:four helix bundle protein